MPEGPAVDLKGIHKRFGDGAPVLNNVSLSAGSGEIISILGPSGCGKTTLLRMIAGLLQPSSGRLEYSGSPASTAYIFQESNLLPWATVEENIALPLRLAKSAREERARIARHWATRVGLQEALGFYPRQLSGGMKMRVSIARALSLQPNLLLLDEPFGALDAITRNRLNEDLLSLHSEARWTAFFVTHSVTEAVFLSSRIVILSSNLGSVATVMKNPLPGIRDARTRESLEFQGQVAEATARLQEVLLHEEAH